MLQLWLCLALLVAVCGLQFNYKHQRSPPWKRIVGGIESEADAWPWQVALLINGTQMCGGSLISREWVVSAAHCFQGNGLSENPGDWEVTLGEHHLENVDWFEQSRRVRSIHLHPRYQEATITVEGHKARHVPPDYDVALLRLATPAKFTNYVYPICLLPQGARFRPGKYCYVTGWGVLQWKGTKPAILREAQVQLVPQDKCNSPQSYNGEVSGRALCAGFERGGVDACQYDSGGPLACEERGRWYLTGVVSYGHECGNPHKYGLYADMATLNTWVENIIQEHLDDES
ncbi:predicted protein [Nematostella vectensis]|uniref:Peptidase S1 domain-containing protein n=1 Tax=Nematostella vectensis TaxID=45351 RepID=A7SSS0_NEMVE|nr:predicted protein [Nematostella vectensis]|eukprot:XP_001625374.1 predicted protein [Nematostella vectensis]